MDSNLEAPTLLLSKMWAPIGTTTARRALSLAYKDAARLVDPTTYRLYSFAEWAAAGTDESGPTVRTPTFEIKTPEVAMLTYHRPVRLGEVVLSERTIFKRDRYTCQYCGAQPPGSALAVDHVVPRAHGGFTSWTNCVAACAACRSRKGNQTPDEAGLLLRRTPRRPDETGAASLPVASPPPSWRAFLNEGEE